MVDIGKPDAESIGDTIQNVVCIGCVWVVVQPQFPCIVVKGSSDYRQLVWQCGWSRVSVRSKSQ